MKPAAAFEHVVNLAIVAVLTIGLPVVLGLLVLLYRRILQDEQRRDSDPGDESEAGAAARTG